MAAFTCRARWSPGRRAPRAEGDPLRPAQPESQASADERRSARPMLGRLPGVPLTPPAPELRADIVQRVASLKGPSSRSRGGGLQGPSDRDPHTAPDGRPGSHRQGPIRARVIKCDHEVSTSPAAQRDAPEHHPGSESSAPKPPCASYRASRSGGERMTHKSASGNGTRYLTAGWPLSQPPAATASSPRPRLLLRVDEGAIRYGWWRGV